jgi:hypothetical protein
MSLSTRLSVMLRVALIALVLGAVGAFAADALFDGAAFYVALAVVGVAIGVSLRWVVPRGRASVR